MKKLFVAATVLALTACSAPSEPQLTIAPTPVIAAQASAHGKALSLESRDLRTAQFIAVVDSGRQNVQPCMQRRTYESRLKMPCHAS